jgi:hypothetical protein
MSGQHSAVSFGLSAAHGFWSDPDFGDCVLLAVVTGLGSRLTAER